jgi:hypothetical protein
MSEKLAVAAGVVCAVVLLDMQHLAGDVKSLAASSGLLQSSRISVGRLRELLAGLLSEQQLAEGRAAVR